MTLLFSDIEVSTRLIDELGEESYVRALAEHRRCCCARVLARTAVSRSTRRGTRFSTSLPIRGKALAAADQGQEALASGAVKERMGLHTGELRLRSEGYARRELDRAARFAASGHGGQVELSAATRALVDGDWPTSASTC